MIDPELLETILDQLEEVCQSSDGFINNETQSVILHSHGLLPHPEAPLVGDVEARTSYMANLSRLRVDIRKGLGSRGKMLIVAQPRNKHRQAIWRLVDGDRGSLGQIMDEPKAIVVRNKGNIARAKRFMAMNGMSLSKLSETQRKSLLAIFSEEAGDTARAMERRYRWWFDQVITSAGTAKLA